MKKRAELVEPSGLSEERFDPTISTVGSELDLEWDHMVSASPYSGFMQSTAWLRFKRSEGYEVNQFGLFNMGKLGGGAALLSYPSSVSEGMLICADGPIVPWESTEHSRKALKMIIGEATALADRQGGLGLRIEPRISPPRPSVMRNWSRAPVDLNPAHSLVIDINQNEDELKRQMHPKGRYNIGVAIRHGVQVRRSTAMQDVKLFHQLFTDTAGRNGFFAEPYSFFLNLCAAHFPSGGAQIFFSEFQGETLASALVIRFGKRATFLYGGSSVEHRRVMPVYLLHWRIIQEMQADGYTEYDLYGFDPFGTSDHPYAGFSRFKKQLGGARFDSLGAYDLIFYDRLADRIVEKLGSAEISG